MCQADGVSAIRILPPALSLAAMLAIGCSTAKPKQANDVDDSPVIADPVDAPEPDPVDDPPPESEPAAPKTQPVVGADDYEMSHSDCAALAQAYGGAWLHDEMEKLNAKKLKQAQFDQAAAQLRKDSDGMAAQYQDECGKTVGTAYLRSRLQCAMKAKTMQRFNDCMDGKVE